MTARRWEQIDPVAALRELSRAVAALGSAVRELAGQPGPPPPAVP